MEPEWKSPDNDDTTSVMPVRGGWLVRAYDEITVPCGDGVSFLELRLVAQTYVEDHRYFHPTWRRLHAGYLKHIRAIE